MALAAICCLAGCGTTLKRGATEQLLASDAVDASVAAIDFRDLQGQSVYFDTTYIKSVQSVGFVNSDYIISSLRQQMLAADCRLKEKKEEADYIVEARVGALGADRHEIVWGLPANNLLGTVASAVPDAPAPPTIPEIALAKKSDELAVAKIGVFAYHRTSGQRIWQAGINQSKSTARDTTVLGVGPFQSGTIHKGTEFAGSKIELPIIGADEQQKRIPAVPYDSEVHFVKPGAEDVIVAPVQHRSSTAIRQVAGEAAAQTSSSEPVVKPEEESPRLLDERPLSGSSEEQSAKKPGKSPRPADRALLTKPSRKDWTSGEHSP